MLHRVQTASMQQYETIEACTIPLLMVVEDQGFEAGDEVYFELWEGAALRWLMRRTIVDTERNPARCKPDECIITVQ